MKHLSVFIAMVICAMTANAQLVQVKSVTKVNTPFKVRQAELAPNGNFVIAESKSDNSLHKIDFTTGKTNKVVENGNLLHFQFSDDSNTIGYVEQTEDQNHLIYKAVKTLNLNTGATKQIQAPTRTLNGISFNKGKAVVVNDKRLASSNLQQASSSAVSAVTSAAPVAYIRYGELMVNNNGVTKSLNPNGDSDQSYLWPSISPDGTKVLYFWVAGNGTYVCNLDGSNPRFISELRAARWLDNNTIVGMRDEDDGHVFTKSAIIVVNTQRVSQSISLSNTIAMYPSISADGSKIAYTTPEGELYIINLNK